MLSIHDIAQFQPRELFSSGMVGTILKFKFSDASQGPTLQASISKVFSFRPVVLKLSGEEFPGGVVA